MLSRRLICLMCLVLITTLVGKAQAGSGESEIVIVPSVTSDDSTLIQTALDSLQSGDTLRDETSRLQSRAEKYYVDFKGFAKVDISR